MQKQSDNKCLKENTSSPSFPLLSRNQVTVSYHDGCSCSATDTSQRTTRSVPATQLSAVLCSPPFVLSHLITLLMKMNRIGQQVLPQITESQSTSPLVVSSHSLEMDIPLCDIHLAPYLDSTQAVRHLSKKKEKKALRGSWSFFFFLTEAQQSISVWMDLWLHTHAHTHTDPGSVSARVLLTPWLPCRVFGH